MIKLTATGDFSSGPVDHPTATGSQFKIIQRPIKDLNNPSPIYVISSSALSTVNYLT